MDRTTTRITDSADATYQAHRARAYDLLAELKAGLDRHAVSQGSDRRNWGYAGDLGHVTEQLAEVLLDAERRFHALAGHEVGEAPRTYESGSLGREEE